MAFILEAIWEADFLGFSYGFRPGRGPHDALDALHAGIYRKRVGWVLDADIQGFFDAMSHDWMLRFLRCQSALNIDPLSACNVDPFGDARRRSYR